MNSLVLLFSTPRGIIYSVLTLLLLFSWITGFGLVKWIAAAFLIYTVVTAASENFSCLKCGLGVVASLSVALVAFELISERFYILALAFMWADAWVHAAG